MPYSKSSAITGKGRYGAVPLKICSTQELEPDGGNLVDDYLKRRGWNEKAPNKAYMHALRDTVMSLYEDQRSRSGQSMTLRDLLRNVAPVTVREHGATQTSSTGTKSPQQLLT